VCVSVSDVHNSWTIVGVILVLRVMKVQI